jgi:MFS family permease
MAAQPQSGSWAEVLGEGRFAPFVLICLSVWLYAADSLVTTTIMPSVAKGLGGYEWLGWATAGYLLGSVAAGASSGLLAQRFGLRRAMASSAALCALGCVLSALAPEMATFLAGRLVQGVAGGWVAGFASVAVAVIFPNQHLPRVYASVTAVWGVATLLGPMIGGLFAELGDAGWRWVFWFFAAQALAVAAAALALMPRADKGDKAARIAWTQLLLVVTGVALIGFSDRTGSFAAAAAMIAVGLAIFIGTLHLDGRLKVRMLPKGAADQTTRAGAGYAAMFLLTASSMAFSVYGPLILQTLLGWSPLQAGYVIASEALAWTAISLTVSHLKPPWPNRLIRAGSVLVAAGVILSIFAFPDPSLFTIVLSGAVMGAGFGLSWAFLAQAIVTSLPQDERAIGSGGMTAIRLTGAASGAAAAAAVANLLGLAEAQTLENARAAGLWVFVASAPVALLGLIPAWRVSRRAPTLGL